MKIEKRDGQRILRIAQSEIDTKIDQALGQPAPTAKPPVNERRIKDIQQRVKFIDWQKARHQDEAHELRQLEQEQAKKREQMLGGFQTKDVANDAPVGTETEQTFLQHFQTEAQTNPEKASALDIFKTLPPEAKSKVYHAISVWDEPTLRASLSPKYNQLGSSELTGILGLVSLLLEEENPGLAEAEVKEKARSLHQRRHQQ